ncbi:MAG: division/cell wall cluster transcriptional repressor MraZ [Phycisphaerales bacterium]
MLFTGQYEHSIDAKNRLAVPSNIRSGWSEKEHGTAWYATPVKPGLIRLYTERAFEERAASAPKTFTSDDDESELQASFFGLSERLEMDSAGRIRLPDGLLEDAALNKEVVIVGAGDRLEIRDRAAWKATLADRRKNLSELMARVAQKQKSS